MSAQDNIFNRLKAAPAFHPGSVELFDDITLEPGDIVTIRSGQTDQTLPIYNQHITWTGSAMTTLESTGNEKRSALPPLQKKQRNSSFGGGRTAYKQEQQLSGYYQHMIESDGVLGMTAGVLGVVLDENGNPIIDPQTGKFVYDDSSSAEIFGRLLVTANRTSLINAINQNGVQISGASLDLDASGNAIITAINDSRTGTATIKGDRIKLSSTSGSCIEVENDGTIKISASNVIDQINNHSGTAIIEAGKVQISGTTTINDVMTISDSGYVSISRVLMLGTSSGNHITLNGGSGTLTAKNINVSSGGGISFVGSQTGEHYDLSASNIQGFIKSASVSGNVLTLTPVYGTAITFSKATTVTGSWDGSGTYTATATQNEETVGTASTSPTLRLNGNGTQSFSAEMLDDSASPTVQKSIYGYLVVSGNTSTTRVNVCSNSDGTGIVAGYSVGSLYTDGQNSVSVVKGAWSGGRISFTPSAGTGASKTCELSKGTETWDGNTCSFLVMDGNGSTGYTCTVNASRRYTAGQNSVSVEKGSWNGGRITFSPSAGTGASKTCELSQGTGSWTGTTYSFPINDGSSSTGYTCSVNASSKLTTKSISSNGTYTPGTDFFGFSSVTVSVPSSDVTGDDITLVGKRSSHSATSTKPTTSIDKSSSAVSGEIWTKLSDGYWHYMRTFSISISVSASIQNHAQGYIRGLATVNGGTVTGSAIKLTSSQISSWGGPI